MNIQKKKHIVQFIKTKKPFIAPTPIIQKKLNIGASNDVYEIEADHVADQVVNIPDNQVQKKSLAENITLLIQKIAISSGGENVASDTITSKINSSKGNGSIMGNNTRNFMESRFDTDFSNVKIHTDSNAIQLSRQLNAQAFTVGDDIYFNKGRYKPNSVSGKHLLAHELTHTIQQKKHTHIKRKLKVSKPNAKTMGSKTVTNKQELKRQIKLFSSLYTVNSSGEVIPVNTSSQNKMLSIQLRNKCLKEMINSPNKWKIIINNNEWPHTLKSSKKITIHNKFSNIKFGAWGSNKSSNPRIYQSLERVLGHELCGHANLFDKGIHPHRTAKSSYKYGRPYHDSTVKIENKIADEIVGKNAPDRGLHSDTHQGESFGKVTIANYPYGVSSITSSLNKKKMRTIFRFLKKDRRLKVDVIGHSDQEGNTMRISKSRARKIARLLRKNRVYKSQIKTIKWVGDRDCKLSGKNSKCRKTEVFMYIYEAAREK